MEQVPSRIAADILIAALDAKLLTGTHDPANIASAFAVIHESVIKAAAQDKEENLSFPHK